MKNRGQRKTGVKFRIPQHTCGEDARSHQARPLGRSPRSERSACHALRNQSPIDIAVVKRSPAMQNFFMRRAVKGRYTRTPQQDLARAELLHRSFPNSQTATLAAAQEVAAHERRAGLIAQLHKEALAAADMSAWQRTLKARIDKDALRRKITVWIFAGIAFVVALACGVVLLWF